MGFWICRTHATYAQAHHTTTHSTHIAHTGRQAAQEAQAGTQAGTRMEHSQRARAGAAGSPDSSFSHTHLLRLLLAATD